MTKTLSVVWVLACSLFVLVALEGRAIAQRGFDNVEIRKTKVADGIWMLEGAGGNIGVSVGDDGLLMIDDQFAPLAEKIQGALDELGKGKLQWLLNTHHHGDHTGGNAHFGQVARIVAHENVRKRLEEGGRGGPTPKVALPVLTYTRAIKIHFNGEAMEIVHFPNGHTDGDSVIFFERAKVIHMGDHFFNGRFPFIDVSSGGTVDGYIRNVKAVLDRIDGEVKIIPGHGALATRTDLEMFHEMLVETSSLVREKAAAGKSLEDVQKEGLPDKWNEWGTGFIPTGRWIETLYRSATAK